MPATFLTALGEQTEALKTEGLFKTERLIAGPQQAEIDVETDGATQHVLNLCANNYLGLANHPEVIAAAHLGMYDPVFGGYTYYVPLLYADKAGYNAVMYIQNGGLECSSIEIWFKAQDDCLRARICEVSTLAPGETIQIDPNDLQAGQIFDSPSSSITSI